MRRWPARLLFFCQQMPLEGGRVFVHSAKAVEHMVRAQGAAGRLLLDKLSTHGMILEFGYLDENHPEKADNYYKSWQELTGCTDAASARAYIHEHMSDRFDSSWWRPEPNASDSGKNDEYLSTLMTRFHFPAFKVDPRDATRYLRFPRIAADGPCSRNGYRRFLLGKHILSLGNDSIK